MPKAFPTWTGSSYFQLVYGEVEMPRSENDGRHAAPDRFLNSAGFWTVNKVWTYFFPNVRHFIWRGPDILPPLPFFFNRFAPKTRLDNKGVFSDG
jgi:hypothetical protein